MGDASSNTTTNAAFEGDSYAAGTPATPPGTTGSISYLWLAVGAIVAVVVFVFPKRKK